MITESIYSNSPKAYKILINDWIEYSTHFSATKKVVAEKELYEYIFSLCIHVPKYKKRLTKFKECLRFITSNLIISMTYIMPIKISRSPQHDKKIYNHCWTYYKHRLILIDTLLKNKFIIHIKNGWHIDGYKGEIGTYYPTKKFYNLCNSYNIKVEDRFYSYETLLNAGFNNNLLLFDLPLIDIEIEPSKYPIILRDENKNNIEYVETQKLYRMGRFIKRRNEFTNKQNIRVIVSDQEIEIKHMERIKVLLASGKLKLTEKIKFFSINRTPIYQSQKKTILLNVIYNHYYTYINNVYIILLLLYTYNNTMLVSIPNVIITGTSEVAVKGLEANEKSVFQGTKKQDKVRIKNMDIQIVFNDLYRVYNTDFNLGGRFYGAGYLELPRHLRKYIYINGSPTIELDYSGLHVKLCYAEKGIDYQEDPYELKGWDNEKPDVIRKLFKLVSLVLINAETYKSSYGGIEKAFKEELEKTIDEDLKSRLKYVLDNPKYIGLLIKEFRKKHEPIKEYLYSGKGLSLQNKDSELIYNIINDLLKLKIVALPVHDSLIVATKYEDILRKLMIKHYKEETGFEPVIH